MDNPAYVLELEKADDSDKVTGKPAECIHTYTFEEAITMAKVGKFHYLLMLICGLCFMSVIVEVMGVSMIMLPMNCDLPSTFSEQGLLASSGFLGVVLSSHIMGFLADTWGRVRSLRSALILSLISSVISAFSTNIWMLIVFRFLNGFFMSGCQACVFSLCGEFHGNRTRARHVTLLSGFLTIGLIYIPSIASVILPLRIDTVIFGITFSSWRLELIVNSIVPFLALMGLFTLPETPKYVLIQGDPEGALEIIRYVYSKNTGKPASEFPVQNIKHETGGANLQEIRSLGGILKLIWGQTVPLFYKERCLQTLNICFIAFVIYFITQGIFMWFPMILNEVVAKDGQGIKVCDIIEGLKSNGSLPKQSNNICEGEVDVFTFRVLTAMGASFTTFHILFALSINKIGKKRLYVGWMLTSIISCIGIHWTSNFSMAVVELTLIPAISICGGVVNTIAMEFFPTNINAIGMCFVMMVGRLGAVVGSKIVGQILIDSCGTFFWVLSGVICCTTLLGFCLPEAKHAKKDQKDVALTLRVEDLGKQLPESKTNSTEF